MGSQQKHTVKFSNGDYECKESYHLVISRKSYKNMLMKLDLFRHIRMEDWIVTIMMKMIMKQ